LRTLAAEHPRLTGAILDSLTPPETSAEWDNSHRSQVTDAVGREVLRHCDDTPDCHARFPHGIVGSYGELLAAKDALRGLPLGDLKVFFGGLLDLPETRERIPDLIGEIPRGDTGALEAVNASSARLRSLFARYPQAPPSIPLAAVISASENNARPGLTRRKVEEEEAGLLFAALLPGQLVDPGLPTYPRDRYFGREPARHPPILVMQGSLDPKTPLAGALARAAQLRSSGKVVFVRVEGAPHAVLLTAPGCFEQAVQEFIARGAVTAPACRTPSSHSAL
jgi:pimeloyl-ACP methyl ester carboxylesterase